MNRTEIRDLADRARDGDTKALRQFKELARADGYVGRIGGWVAHSGRPESAVCQGWQRLARLIYFGGATFTRLHDVAEAYSEASIENGLRICDRMDREDRAAGVDMGAIHAEALAEYREVTRAVRQADSAAYQRELQREIGLKIEARREMQEAADEQATPRYRCFNREGKGYRTALDILHAEAIREDGDRNAREFDRVQKVYNESHLRGERGRVYDSRRAHTEALAIHLGRKAAVKLRAMDAPAHAEDDGEGWGQPDGMLGAPTGMAPGVIRHSIDCTNIPEPGTADDGMPIDVHPRPVIIEAHVDQIMDTHRRNNDKPTSELLMDYGVACAEVATKTDERQALASFNRAMQLRQEILDCIPEPNTPAEARTGTPDRVAAVLNELIGLRNETLIGWWEYDEPGRDAAAARIDRIVGILRGEDDV